MKETHFFYQKINNDNSNDNNNNFNIANKTNNKIVKS